MSFSTYQSRHLTFCFLIKEGIKRVYKKIKSDSQVVGKHHDIVQPVQPKKAGQAATGAPTAVSSWDPRSSSFITASIWLVFSLLVTVHAFQHTSDCFFGSYVQS